MTILRKIIRGLIIIVMLIVLAIVGSILVFDPPPWRLQDENEFVLSVTPPVPDGSRPIEAGLACKHKLESRFSNSRGRPQITLFDWLKRQLGNPPERDYQLYGSKPNETWAIKPDRATNSFCYHSPRDVQAGLTEPYCGLKITDEGARRIVAVEHKVGDFISAVVFDKEKNTLTLTSLSISTGGAAILYLECH